MDRGSDPTRNGHTTLLAVGTLLLTVLMGAPPGTGNASPALAISERPSATGPSLAVDPETWWMPAGNVTLFTATWVDPTPDCTLAPYWFRWSVAGGSAEGTVDPTVGSVVNFSATSVSTGRTTLLVRSAAVLACGPMSSPVFAAAEANVTVVTPIAVENLSVGPDPVGAGGTAFLRGTLTGGSPPYALRVAWGDGTNASVSVPAAGPFSIPHAFPAGEYVPWLDATDSGGLLARARVGEALAASDSLAVGIDAGSYVADVGFPVPFNATVLHPPAQYSTGWTCGSLAPRSGASVSSSTDFSCAFSLPGTGQVFFEVLPPAPLSPVNATLDESVVPAPTLTVRTPNLTAEVGQPSLVTFSVTGGVPPFLLDWAETGSGIAGSVRVATDGRLLLPIVPAEAGSLELAARLTDSDGFTTSNTTTRLLVDPSLSDSIVSDRTPTSSGEAIALTGSVTAGTPPFVWVVIPADAPSNETADLGDLGSVGWFGWSATYRTEGWTSLDVTVVDDAGGLSTTTIDLEAVLPLTGNLSLDPGNPPEPGTFTLGVSLAGGLPPFVVTVNAADGESWNHTVSSDSNTTWVFPASEIGSLELRITAVDSAAGALVWNATVRVSAPLSLPPLGPGGSATGSWDGVALSLGLAIVVVGLFVYRRRRPSASPAPPDPVAILRHILEPAEGADRATVELLAEEAGVPLGLVRSTIDRLIVAGTIRTDSGVDDEEVISWSADAPS